MELFHFHFKIIGMHSLILWKSKGIVNFFVNILEKRYKQSKRLLAFGQIIAAGDDQQIPVSCARVYVCVRDIRCHRKHTHTNTICVTDYAHLHPP